MSLTEFDKFDAVTNKLWRGVDGFATYGHECSGRHQEYAGRLDEDGHEHADVRVLDMSACGAEPGAAASEKHEPQVGWSRASLATPTEPC